MNCFLLFVLAFISSTKVVAPYSNKDRATTDLGFVARLIYRTSPASPFYDPNITTDDIVKENLQISAARQKYLAQMHAAAKGNNSLTLGMLAVVPVSRDFVMVFNIGTPPLETIGIPDTGSGLIWLQCGPCDNCYSQIGPLFDRRNSSTYEPIYCWYTECRSSGYGRCGPDDLLCQYDISYVQGPRSQGELAKETLKLGWEDENSIIVEDVIFGCGTNNTDTLGERIPSIIGMRNSTVSLIGQLKGPKRFSYCHNYMQSGGYIRFGSEAHLLGGKTPLVPNSSGNYHLILEGINVDDEEVDISRTIFMLRDDVYRETGVVIDSGATYTYLQPEALDAVMMTMKSFLSEYVSMSTEDWELCYGPKELGPRSYADLPEMTFKFKDLHVRLWRRNVWQYDRQGNACLAIKRYENKSKSSFGMYQQNSFNVGYDLDEKWLYMEYQPTCKEF